MFSKQGIRPLEAILAFSLPRQISAKLCYDIATSLNPKLNIVNQKFTREKAHIFM